jgi:ATP-dependent RNA helicase DDX5/DBP2
MFRVRLGCARFAKLALFPSASAPAVTSLAMLRDAQRRWNTTHTGHHQQGAYQAAPADYDDFDAPPPPPPHGGHHGHGHDAHGHAATAGASTHHHHAAPAAAAASASAPASGAAPASDEVQVEITDINNKPAQVERFHLFADLPHLPPWLQQGIRDMKYAAPTTIQSYTIPMLNTGADAIGLAPTGSGKTVAFAIPSLAKLKPSNGNPQVLVLCPVRELVQQTAKVFRSLCAHTRLRVCEAYGGSPRNEQMGQLHRGCDILVAAPGRLVDFLQSGAVDLGSLQFLVFDEADRLLDMGFSDALDTIMGYVPKERQTMMWSATWPDAVRTLANNYLLRTRLTIRAGGAGGDSQLVNHNIKQIVSVAATVQDRVKQVIDIFRKAGPEAKAIVFVMRKDTCEEVSAGIGRALQTALGTDARTIQALHGGMHQSYRDRVVRAFKQGQVRVLVATDVAARGLDFPDVEYVINFDAPHEIDSYCHRIGRTGRAGRKGTAYTILMQETAKVAPDLVLYLRKSNQEVIPAVEEMARSYDQLAAAKRRGKWDKFRGNRNGGGGGGGRGFGGGGRGGGGYGGGRGGGGGYGGGYGGGGGNAGYEY